MAAMSAYRDRELFCPHCKGALRAFHARLVCDACNGIQLGHADFKKSIEDLANAACTLEWTGDATKRPCPQCGVAMTAATLEIRFDDERLRSRQPTERCLEHGAWFDDQELAQVYLLVERTINRGTGMAARNLPRDRDLSRFTGDAYGGPFLDDPWKKK